MASHIPACAAHRQASLTHPLEPMITSTGPPEAFLSNNCEALRLSPTHDLYRLLPSFPGARETLFFDTRDAAADSLERRVYHLEAAAKVVLAASERIRNVWLARAVPQSGQRHLRSRDLGPGGKCLQMRGFKQHQQIALAKIHVCIWRRTVRADIDTARGSGPQRRGIRVCPVYRGDATGGRGEPQRSSSCFGVRTSADVPRADKHQAANCAPVHVSLASPSAEQQACARRNMSQERAPPAISFFPDAHSQRRSVARTCSQCRAASMTNKRE